jgi:hypothetical protein
MYLCSYWYLKENHSFKNSYKNTQYCNRECNDTSFLESNIDCEEAGNLCETERHVRHQVIEYVLCKYTHILAWATQNA